MVEGTMLDNLCVIADTADIMVSEINRLFEIPFTTELIEKRNQLLALNYDNLQNAQKIIRVINNSPDDL
jgi:hypothetical protein